MPPPGPRTPRSAPAAGARPGPGAAGGGACGGRAYPGAPPGARHKAPAPPSLRRRQPRARSRLSRRPRGKRRRGGRLREPGRGGCETPTPTPPLNALALTLFEKASQEQRSGFQPGCVTGIKTRGCIAPPSLPPPAGVKIRSKDYILVISSFAVTHDTSQYT